MSVPSLELGPPPPPPQASVLPTGTGGGGVGGDTHSGQLVFEGVRESQFGRLERKLSTLSALWLSVRISEDFSTTLGLAAVEFFSKTKNIFYA